MADALAISAAVVQFLDVAVRLTLQLSSLYKEVQNVPEKLRRLQVDIDQQITIAKYVQSTHAIFWHDSPPTSAISMPIDQSLADYITIMEQLLEVMKIIIMPNDTGIIRRSWSALRATQKCKEAITLCDALEKKKSNITMWLSTANIELSSEIKKLVDGVDKKIDQVLHLTQKQGEAFIERDMQSSKIPALLSELSINTYSTLSQLSGATSSSQRQLLALTANTEAHTRTLVEQWQELSPTFHEFRNILQQSSHLQQSVRKVTRGTQDFNIQGDQQHHVSEDAYATSKVPSVYDEDHLGNTLLFEVMDLYVWRVRVPYHPYAQDFVSLIQFLLDSGSDPNIRRRVSHKEFFGSSLDLGGGTVLDVFAIPLRCQEPIFRNDCPTRPLVFQKLLDSDACFSRPLSESRKRKHGYFHLKNLEKVMDKVEAFEEQFEVCNLSNLMIAIIRRHKLNFNNAMAKDNINQASDANGLAAIHFAVYWPWALRRLIEAGADVNCEDSLGRRPIHIATACGQAEAVRLLLDADCALNPPNWSLSLLHESLRLGRDFDSVTSCIIDALIDRHTRLAKLASSVLPEYRKLEQLGQNCINEMDAPKLFDAMAGSEYSVDPALAADRHGLGVYDTADLHADIRLTPTLADQLWDELVCSRLRHGLLVYRERGIAICEKPAEFT
ncbi:hypothetical protein E8E14_005247 [Neopestalotiopsis sp. 37M]|nr:hypothetical protein E8E14_005247 [Neopestalotiopsis sp. 37M]